MKLTWKKSVSRNGPVIHKLYLGKIRAGSFYESLHGGFCAYCRLSGRKNGVEKLETLEAAKAWVEQRVREWVSDAGLTGGSNEPQ